jgi:hypothetical protein
MTTAVMLDLETMGYRTRSVILTVGALKFDPYNKNAEPGAGFYARLNVDQQFELDRTIDESTLDWWSEQDPVVREEAFAETDRMDIDVFTAQLNRFLVGVDEFWAQGPTFDMVIMESLYRDLNQPAPWSYSRVMDSRTLFRVAGDPRPKNNTGAHNAMIDCYNQAIAVQTVIANLGIQR